MKHLIVMRCLAMGLLLSCAHGAAATDPPANPFEQAEQGAFAGRFTGQEMQIQLKPEGRAWSGSLVFKGRTYPLTGERKDGKLEGTFVEGDQAWSFQVQGEGTNLTFTAGSFTTALRRQELPRAAGIYRSPRVVVEFVNTNGATNGVITYTGQQMPFSAVETAGDLEGAFQSGAQSFKFSLVPEGKGWVFKTGQFSEVLGLAGRPAEEFREAAARGEADAQLELGWCYAKGYGVVRDVAEAARWYRKAADQGHAYGENNLGFCYHNGQGVAKDFAEAVRWYRNAAEQGNALAQVNLGICHQHGQGVATNWAEAVKWYRKAAEQGNDEGLFKVGACYYDGTGVAKDYAEAVRWYRQAADKGNVSGQFALGVCHQQGLGVATNLAEAAKWYRRAAEQGNAVAQRSLGTAYANGQGVDKDLAEGIKWYRKAADQGDAYGQCLLGFCYYNGQGTAKDGAEAVKWHRKAAEQGNAYGQFGLGVCYYAGEGVAKDYAEAVKWYRKAAEQGYAGAQDRLGICYYYGRGVAKDFTNAVAWCGKALDGGIEQAAIVLAQVYLKQGRAPEAVTACKQVLTTYQERVQASPEEMANYMTLAWANLLCGRAKEAEQQARTGLNLRPQTTNEIFVANLKISLGHALLCQGPATQTIELYREALKLGIQKDELADDFELLKLVFPSCRARFEAVGTELGK